MLGISAENDQLAGGSAYDAPGVFARPMLAIRLPTNRISTRGIA